jgi:multiple antibiotic resistance protein
MNDDHADFHLDDLHDHPGADQDGARVLPSYEGPDSKAARALAFKGALTATAICLFAALVMRGMAAAWQVSVDELRIAGGILLFAASYDVIQEVFRPHTPPPPTSHPALSPLAIPIIVTPWGFAAILVFMGLAEGDLTKTATILGLLLLTMALNLVGMLFARSIMTLVGFAVFQVIGWIFAVLQAGLAVEAIVLSLRNLGLFRPH